MTLTKDSPEVQDLLARIKEVVNTITGPVGNLWVNEDHQIEITYDQNPPTQELRDYRPGRYSLLVTCDILDTYGIAHSWHIHEGRDKTDRWWYLPGASSDDALLKVLHS